MDEQDNKQTLPTPYSAPVTPPASQEPTVVPPPQFASTEAPAPISAPKKKKGLLIGIIVGVVVLLLGVAAALVYFLWYQNPDKVVTDGMLNAMQAKTGTFTATLDSNDESKTSMTLAGKVNEKAMSIDAGFSTLSSGKTVSVKGGGVVDFKGDIYVKVANAKELITSLFSSLSSSEVPASVVQPMNDFAAKVNDQWIKISAEDMKSVSTQASDTQKCTQAVTSSFMQDNVMKSEIGKLYEQNRFIVISKDLGEQNGSKGFELKGDNAKAKSFILGLKNTKLYKDLNACDKSFVIEEKDLSSIDSQDNSMVTTELWVNTWTHQITKLSVKSNEATNKSSMVIEPVFNGAVSIDIPSSSKTVKDVIKDLEDMQAAIMQAAYGTSTTDYTTSQL
jgi:hypothetical protein